MYVNTSVSLTLSLEILEKCTEDSTYNELSPTPLSLVMEEQINSAFIRACLCDYGNEAWLTHLNTGLFCHRGQIDFSPSQLFIASGQERSQGRLIKK